MKSDGSVLIRIKRTRLKGFKQNDQTALVRSGLVKMIFIFNLSPATIILVPAGGATSGHHAEVQK
jgi:hypothetical protein